MAFGVARTRGFAIDEQLVKRQVDDSVSQLKSAAEEALTNRDRISDPPIAVSYALLGFASSDYPRDEVTGALAQVAAAWQDDNGRFHSLPPVGPPLESSDVTATALSTGDDERRVLRDGASALQEVIRAKEARWSEHRFDELQLFVRERCSGLEVRAQDTEGGRRRYLWHDEVLCSFSRFRYRTDGG